VSSSVEQRQCVLVAGDLEATFLPGLGMLGASLRHRGEEMLGRTEMLDRYVSSGSTMGIPLLHPWANRLAGFGYEAAGRTVALEPTSRLLHLDGNGLPIHGVPGALLTWKVVSAEARCVEARLDWESDPMLDVFPFPHHLVMRAFLDPNGLAIETSLEPTAGAAVPASFGFHPYVRLPGLPREAWRLELPPMRKLALDERGIPTGSSEPYAGSDRALAGLDLDDGFGGLPPRPCLAISGGGVRVAVTFLAGYPYAQVFAPANGDYVALEPMTAPTNALVSGDGLRLVSPGQVFHAAFRIDVLKAEEGPADP
jgi:galactose mutarotase-like enzyme